MRIHDNSAVPKGNFDSIKILTDKIANKTLEQLEKEGVFIFPELVKDAEDITKDQTVLRSVDLNYCSGNVMGFLGLGSERLIIQSRFSPCGNDYFSQYLLEKVLGIPNILDLDTDANQDDHLFNLLLFLFPYYLKIAMHKGAFKMYVCRQYNDSNVKGTIDVARHIEKNTPFMGKISYHQREFSYDNYVMEIIRHTIELIKEKPYGNSVLHGAKDEVAAVIALTGGYQYFDRQKIIAVNSSHPIRHAYYREYRSLQRLCIMILHHWRHRIGSGNRRIRGIVFDGSWLWEEYVGLLMGHSFYHPRNKGHQGAQQLFTTNTGKTGLIYPDFIGKKVPNRVIADAKYKPVGNIHGGDYLQLLAYMYRFDSKRGAYLYPESGDRKPLELKMNEGLSCENMNPREDVLITKCGLQIPQNCQHYGDFVAAIQKNEEVFIEQCKDQGILQIEQS